MKKYKKYIISFVVAFCFAFYSAFFVFADTNYFSCRIAQPQISAFDGYVEIQTSSKTGYVCIFSVATSYVDVPQVKFEKSDGYLLFSITNINSTDYSDINISACIYSVSDHSIKNFGHPASGGSYDMTVCRFAFSESLTGLNFYNCYYPYGTYACSYEFVYGSDIVSNEKLDNIYAILQSLNGIDTSKAPQQSDKDTISSTDSKQDELMESTNPTDKTESLQTDLMSFVNSAPDTLNVAKSMFDRLVSGKIGIIVFGSVCLAIFPLLINVIKGRGG